MEKEKEEVRGETYSKPSMPMTSFSAQMHSNISGVRARPELLLRK
jgi:hypothetical protein